jgi:nitrate/nitrite transporter NarK
MVFVVFGCLGVIWAYLWSRWFRDEPRDHPAVSPGERELIERSRGDLPNHHADWREVFRTPRLLPLCVQYFANTYGFYFFITWLPAYLTKSHGMVKVELATFAGLPLLLSVLADIGGGVTTDWLTRRFGLWIGRCGLSSAAYLFAAIAMAAGTLLADGRAAAILIALGGAASMFTLAPAWAVAIELGGTNAAVLSATMNTAGQVGGVLSPLVLAYIVERFGNWNMPLQVLAALYAIAAVSWILVKPARVAPVVQTTGS